MEPDTQLAPPIVSVVVVHDPGEWFDETLASLAAQTYPNLRHLFVVDDRDGSIAELTERIHAVLPTAYVRSAPSIGGFGSAASQVLRLVEGDRGFFLICHDDVALDPHAVRILLEEIYRSNAGVVGPKLVDWDEPRLLQTVGLGLDRFGEVDSVVEPGEYDQEQHDAVRDVFVVPSACMLIRADLFRELGGFDPAITFHGEDVDLCWRAHLTGARVVVVPDAVVKHRGRLAERRPDLPHRALRSRHRMRAVATLTAGNQLPVRSAQVTLFTLVELIIGLFTGRSGEAWSSLRALLGLIPRTGSLVARRREIRPQRVVPDAEVRDLQLAGSARLSSFLRSRQTATYVGDGRAVRRWREASFGPFLAWFAVIVAIVIGSRVLIRDGVPAVGEFLPFPESPRDLAASYRTAFDGRGFGATAAQPTGIAALAVLSVVSLFRMALLRMLTVVGLALLGALGVWRLGSLYPSSRARIAALVVYVGTPLLPTLLGSGGWSGLVVFAALPWLVHLLRRVAGIGTADPELAASDLPDGVGDVTPAGRVRAGAWLTLVLGAAAAFVPSVVAVWAGVGVLLVLATVAARGAWPVAGWMLGGTAVSSLGAVVLNLPWSLSWSWVDLTASPLAGPTGTRVAEVATLAQRPLQFSLLALALYVPLVGAAMIARAWRLTWSVRGVFLVAGFGTLLLVGRDWMRLPADGELAVPIALGLALGAAAVAGGFGSDVLERGFGWRQPVGVLANIAIVVGLVPGVVAIGSGDWGAPQAPLPELLASQLPADPAAGDYRVLYVGDPRLLPVPGREYAPGISFAVTDAGGLDVTDRFPVPATVADDAVAGALDIVSTSSSLRAGRLLAPLGIRFVVVPLYDGVASTEDRPIAPPEGLLTSLGAQLDLAEMYGPPSLAVFSNESWIPVGAQLSGRTADASRQAGAESISRADLRNAEMTLYGADTGVPAATGEITPGVVHLAIPYDGRLRLDVGGEELVPRPSFGSGTAFDVERGGSAELRYRADGHRTWWVAAQLAMWLLVTGVAGGSGTLFRRTRRLELADETLIDLGSGVDDTGQIRGEALGLVPSGRDDADPWDDADAWADGIEEEP